MNIPLKQLMSWSGEHISGETYYLCCSREIVHLGRTESRIQMGGWYRFCRVQFLNVHTEKLHACADTRGGVKLHGLTGFFERVRFSRGALIEASAFITWRIWSSVQWPHLHSSCPDSRTGDSCEDPSAPSVRTASQNGSNTKWAFKLFSSWYFPFLSHR